MKSLSPEQGASKEKDADEQKKEHGKKPERTFVTAGEKINKIITYGGVDWLFNACSGVAFAYWGKRTQSGQKYWSEPLTKGFTKILTPLIKDPAKLETSVGRGNMFISIMMGGMFTIPPLLVLEHNPVKKAITKKLDTMIYGKDKVEHDPKFIQAYKEMDEEPKKDFGTGMYTRFMALAPLLATILIPTTSKLSSKYYFDPAAKAMKTAGRAVGIKPGEKYTTVQPGFKDTHEDFVYDTFSLDFLLGPWYAVMHGAFYDFFSKLKKPSDKPGITDRILNYFIPDKVAEAKRQESSAAKEKIAAPEPVIESLDVHTDEKEETKPKHSHVEKALERTAALSILEPAR